MWSCIQNFKSHLHNSYKTNYERCWTNLVTFCSSSLEKLNNVQARAEEIISRAVSSTNNLKIQQEWRKTVVDCWAYKQNSQLQTEHISHWVLKNWNCKMRLRKSSALLFDKNIREEIDLRTKTLKITNETPFLKPVPGNATITLDLTGLLK